MSPEPVTEIERLRTETYMIDKVRAERDKAEAEVERLVAEIKVFNHSSGGKVVRYVTRRLTFLDAAKMAGRSLYDSHPQYWVCKKIDEELRRAAEGVKDGE